MGEGGQGLGEEVCEEVIGQRGWGGVRQWWHRAIAKVQVPGEEMTWYGNRDNHEPSFTNIGMVS